MKHVQEFTMCYSLTKKGFISEPIDPQCSMFGKYAPVCGPQSSKPKTRIRVVIDVENLSLRVHCMRHWMYTAWTTFLWISSTLRELVLMNQFKQTNLDDKRGIRFHAAPLALGVLPQWHGRLGNVWVWAACFRMQSSASATSMQPTILAFC